MVSEPAHTPAATRFILMGVFESAGISGEFESAASFGHIAAPCMS
jgi:hypothetical protein